MPLKDVLIKLFICVFYDFFVRNSLVVTNQEHIGGTIQLLDSPSNDHIAVLFIQLDHTTNPIRLFAGDQGTAATAEGVEHDAIRHAGVQNRIRQQFHRLHGRMVSVLFGFIEFPYRRLLPVCIPFVFTLLLPAEQDRFMSPLIRAPASHQRSFLPDTGAGEIESRVRERPAEVQPLRICMEYVDRRIVRHTRFHILK